MIVARPSQPPLQLHNRGSIAIAAMIPISAAVSVWVIAALITVSAVSVWVVGIRVIERKERKTEVIENDDLVEMVEATKPVVPIKVSVVETVEATKPIIPIKVAVIETVEATKPVVPIKVPVVETAKPITPIEVPVVETVETGSRIYHWSVVHRHPRHRSTVASHLRRRSRDREYARYHATEENEFFRVHNFMGF
jgi:hypothetical protein